MTPSDPVEGILEATKRSLLSCSSTRYAARRGQKRAYADGSVLSDLPRKVDYPRVGACIGLEFGVLHKTCSLADMEIKERLKQDWRWQATRPVLAGP